VGSGGRGREGREEPGPDPIGGEMRWEKNSATFWRKCDARWELSNFAPLPVSWRGVEWPTSEAVYQAMKTRDEALRERIRNASSPYGAKKVAWANKSLWREDWEEVKVDAMRWTLRLKARDNWDVIGPVLAETRGRDIVELSQKDAFWGGWYSDGVIVGENWLGRLWMEIRDCI
jgi:ribA/ribD-fused uncharacterized protein